jgi:hypothetical protein
VPSRQPATQQAPAKTSGGNFDDFEDDIPFWWLHVIRILK